MDINLTLIGEAITFALLVLFTMKFVWPPLNGMLEERAKRIADGLAAAEKGKQELAKANDQVANEMKKIQARSSEIVANAEKRADQIVELAKEKARTEGEKILADAKAQIEQEAMRAKEALRSQVAGLVVAGAEQILRAEVNRSRHEELLAKLKAEF